MLVECPGVREVPVGFLDYPPFWPRWHSPHIKNMAHKFKTDLEEKLKKLACGWEGICWLKEHRGGLPPCTYENLRGCDQRKRYETHLKEYLQSDKYGKP